MFEPLCRCLIICSYGLSLRGVAYSRCIDSLQIADKTSEQLVVAESATDARAPVIYADLLGSLFELIAKTLEINQPLVETKYGV